MNTTIPKTGEYRSLDAWRGFASLSVVFFHVTMPIAALHPEITTNPLYFLSRYGCFGVWMFFVISGYCIANAACKALPREHGLSAYAKARLRRIYPACWFSAILYFAFSAGAALLVTRGVIKSSAVGSQDVLHQRPLYYFANLTLTQRLLHQPYLQGVYWTLCYEVAFYLVVGLFLFLSLRHGSLSKFLNCLHAVTILSLALLLLLPSVKLYPLDFWPYFGLGVLVYARIRAPKEAFSRWALALAGGEILLLAALHPGMKSLLDEGGSVSLMFAFVFAALLLVLHRSEARFLPMPPVKWLSWVGLFSYSLYLTHYLVVSVVSKAFEMKGRAGSGYPLCFVLSVLASVAFARLFFQFCERPFLKSRRRRVALPDARLPLAAGLPELPAAKPVGQV